MARRPDAAPRRGGPRRPAGDTPAPAGGKAAPAGGPAARRDIASDPDLVLLGEFGRAHGLAGEVRVKSYTGDPEAIGRYGVLTGADGRAVEILSLRPATGIPDILIARVKGVSGRTGAESLNRLALYAPRERLGAPEDEDEFLTADLVGLAVHDRDGSRVGTVRAVPNYGGGDLLDIVSTAGASALLPFTRAFVPEVDIAGRRLTIDPPEDLFAPARPEPDTDPD
ncbi:ribosome maturation factor RimM [Methylobacterium oryzihabitans]|uniref:Ribosome maturation factor RimM n=1 Tax=Methylobacterium oryzihabitans TaxID=2499852 RepID=A0A437NUZ6_9HYPH|nr:ribosome maturation factor RimM [Methylobacterium oryzihabitans]RVU13738.1 ribosome maturation factor RimM [Methylobacterium oryzihabitans]